MSLIVLNDVVLSENWNCTQSAHDQAGSGVNATFSARSIMGATDSRHALPAPTLAGVNGAREMAALMVGFSQKAQGPL